MGRAVCCLWHGLLVPVPLLAPALTAQVSWWRSAPTLPGVGIASDSREVRCHPSPVAEAVAHNWRDASTTQTLPTHSAAVLT